MTRDRETPSVCLEVTINGESRALAGGPSTEVVTAIVTQVVDRGEIDLRVGGILSTAEDESEHVDWMKARPLRVGDTVTVRVVESTEPDPPEYRDPQSSAEIVEESRRRYEEKRKLECE